MDNFTWECPICGNHAYQKYGGHTEKGIRMSNGVVSEVSIVMGRHFCCKGCSIFFSNPRIFNKTHIESQNNKIFMQEKSV